MTSRRLRPGTKIHIPKKSDRTQWQHPMEKLQLKEALLLFNRTAAAADNDNDEDWRPVNLLLTIDAIVVGTYSYAVDELKQIRIDYQQAADNKMPELLPADKIESESNAQSAKPASKSSISNSALLTITLENNADDEEDDNEEDDGCRRIRLQFSASYGESVIAHSRLWFPAQVHEESVLRYEHAAAVHQDAMMGDQENVLFATNSCILTQASVLATLHQGLPQPAK